MIMNSSSFINTNPILLSLRIHPIWAVTHFGWPCWLVHRSGRVCPGSAGSWLKLFDCKPAFMSGVPRPASSNLRGPYPQTLTLLGGARFITWCLRHPFLRQGPRNFFEMLGVSGLWPCTWIHLKKALCHTCPVGRTNERQILTFSQLSNLTVCTNTSICCTNTLILYICSVYSIHLFNLVSLLPCLLSGP